ncbi:MAG: EAL domain-containing protein, partial [Oscillospiraceae bacterium]
NEIKVLDMGAWDFVPKPYNPKILKFRLKNAIQRSRLAALEKLKYLAEYDSLTGIYNKYKFFSATKQMLSNYPEKKFAIVRVDVERFQLINSFYGLSEGDKLLIFISEYIKNICENFKISTYARIEADIFAICMPIENVTYRKHILSARKALKKYNSSYDIVPKFGIYLIEDPTLPISIMYDRASLAAKKCKGNYINNYAFYDKSLSEYIEKEQEIVNEMNNAIKSEEFSIYLQPKYSLDENKFYGAEALIRWIHPKKGVISPAEFIPIFERNGFITKIDYYVWEKTCKFIKNQIDCGKTPKPISVNVSRLNLYNPKFIDTVCNLTKKYEIPNYLLNLELTESTYIENPELMIESVEKLQAKGFIVMMDDFGSGYSSLSILKDIKIDVLKIDMGFFTKTKIESRSLKIIASVIKMAKVLEIPVIAEGVETQSQVKFLKELGCEYAQGYYYARPIPTDEYIAFLEK